MNNIWNYPFGCYIESNLLIMTQYALILHVSGKSDKIKVTHRLDAESCIIKQYQIANNYVINLVYQVEISQSTNICVWKNYIYKVNICQNILR